MLPLRLSNRMRDLSPIARCWLSKQSYRGGGAGEQQRGAVRLDCRGFSTSCDSGQVRKSVIPALERRAFGISEKHRCREAASGSQAASGAGFPKGSDSAGSDISDAARDAPAGMDGAPNALEPGICEAVAVSVVRRPNPAFLEKINDNSRSVLDLSIVFSRRRLRIGI